jgi:hypothetical protein
MRAQPSRNVSAAKSVSQVQQNLVRYCRHCHLPFLNRHPDSELGPALPDRGSQIFGRMMPVDAFYCRDAPSSLATVQMSTPACVVGEQGGTITAAIAASGAQQ